MTPEQLKMIRAKSGMSQSKFAEKMQCSASHLSHMECGEAKITKQTAAYVRLLFCAKKVKKTKNSC